MTWQNLTGLEEAGVGQVVVGGQMLVREFRGEVEGGDVVKVNTGVSPISTSWTDFWNFFTLFLISMAFKETLN